MTPESHPVDSVETDFVAAAEAALAAAKDGQEAAEANLVTVKAICKRDCAEAQADLAAAVTPEEREIAIWAEEAAHAAHRGPLEAAYAEFGKVAACETNLRRARAGFGPVGSNPAQSGVVTPLTSAVHVEAEAATS